MPHPVRSLRPLRPTRRALLLSAVVAGGAAGGLAACTQSDGTSSSAAGGSAARTDVSSLWDPTALHTIDATVDADELTAMIQTYRDSGDKEWITGSVTIDGTSFEEVGFKLKGNSSLKSIATDDDPATLPWRIRLDKYVDDQGLEGAKDIVVRDNSTPSSLNEAVALDLLAEAGLASQLSVSTALAFNGGDPQLRLILEFLDDDWMASVFSADGILYKAKSDGDYSYRGDDAEDYTDIFDVEGGEEDFAPLIALLKCLEEADDEEFAEQLPDLLEVDLFARYLALEDLIGNFDDIEGPGNNSYLYYGPDTETITIVAWDHNLAFGAQNGGGGSGMPDGGGMPSDGGGERPEDGERPDPGEMPDGATMPSDGGGDDGGAPGGGMGGGMSGGNVLASRFTADEDFAALVEEQATALRTDLVDSGRAQEILDARAAVLTEQASELITAEEVTTDSEQISSVLGGDDGS